MKLDLSNLPEIVETLKVTDDNNSVLTCVMGKYQWKDAHEGWNCGDADDYDAANACIVAMQTRIAATKNYAVAVASDGILIIDCKMVVKHKYPGDLLNALFAAVKEHPRVGQGERMKTYVVYLSAIHEVVADNEDDAFDIAERMCDLIDDRLAKEDRIVEGGTEVRNIVQEDDEEEEAP